MELSVNCGIWGAMFGVPCIVADNFLKLATGEQIKVLLYLLRCSGKICSCEEIAANTGVSASEAEDAVLFWQQANVITPAGGINPATASPVMAQPAPPPEQAPAAKQVASPSERRSPYSGSEIAAIMKDSQDIKELFKVSESILGTLKNSQMNSIIWMYDHLGLKKEVIITLISYCASIEKVNTGYIEKIASVWAENEINSMEAAQEEIQKLTQSRDYISAIMKAFEMNRRPTAKQAEFISQWRNAGFRIELIHYAYEKTIEQINKLSFDYINKILMSWRDSGFTSANDVKNAETEFRKKKKPSGGRTGGGINTNIEEYETVINQFLDLGGKNG